MKQSLKITSGALCLLALAPLATKAADLYDIGSATSGNTFAADSGAGGAGGSVSTANNQLTFTHGGAGGSSTGDYFVGKFDLTTLQVGDTISLSFTVTAPNPSLVWNSQSFRFGLFNIGDSDASTTDFGDATGFRADYGRNTGSVNGFRERDGSAVNLFANASGTFVGTQSSSSFSYANTPVGTFSGSLSLTLLEGDILAVTTNFAGVDPTVGNIQLSDTDALSFNAFSIFITKHAAPDSNAYVFSDLTVSYSSIPEPAVTGLLAGAAALLGVALMRRARSRKTRR